MCPFLLINNFETGIFPRTCRIPKVEESQGLYTLKFYLKSLQPLEEKLKKNIIK